MATGHSLTSPILQHIILISQASKCQQKVIAWKLLATQTSGTLTRKKGYTAHSGVVVNAF